MKKNIFLLSSMTSLLFGITGYTTANTTLMALTTMNGMQNNNTNINNVNINHKTLLPPKPICNNEYDLFANSDSKIHTDWITNQSTTDGKFYSYDTSALGGYGFKDARKAFIVDSNGNLVANPAVKVPPADQNDINNTQQEMITHRHVTTIANDYDPYSKNIYDTSYFTGDDSGWKYLQLGGYNPNIDISQQNGGAKVAHSNELNDSLAFYYIAQAVSSTTSSISWEVAKNLTHYVIDQSDINNKDSVKTIADVLIPLIANNSTIYQYMRTSPVQLNDKSFSFNYILDSNNNLVALYYNWWIKNINENSYFNYENWFNGTSSYNTFNYSFGGYAYYNIQTNKQLMFSWSKYAPDWATFTKIYPKISFGANSVIGVASSGYRDDEKHGSDIFVNTTDIDNHEPNNNSHQFCQCSIYYNYSIFTATIISSIWMWIWHDNNNIYVNIGGYEHSENAKEGLHFWLNLDYCILNTNMN